MRHRAGTRHDVVRGHRRLRRSSMAVAAVLAAGAIVGVPAVGGSAPVAHAAGAVYIDEPLQSGTLDGWSLQGAGNVSNPDGSQGASWLPHLTTVAENNAIAHSFNTNLCGVGTTPDQWPTCTATYDAARDSKWLTLTTDDTNNGGGQAGTALHNTAFDSGLGVVLEYDQRVYRTNNGRSGGTPANQGGGDGIAVYLADAAPPDYGNASVDTTAGEAGGYGAGLGYSAVSNAGDAWCPAQQGVSGGYIGVGFDVYGNYQKAEREQGFGQYHRATRPFSVAQGNPDAFTGVDASVKSARIPQSIGLRGSGIRYTTAPGCNAAVDSGMNSAYGLLPTNTPLVTNAGMHTIFQVKWAAGDTAAQYTGEYQPGGAGAWTSVPAQEVPASLLPAGFADARGYVMFTVPDTVASFSFRYTKAGNATTGTFPGVTRDVSLGNAPAFTALNRAIGGYRWLAGTKNLSTYANPATTGQVAANDAALRGAVIDNAATDATDYRRIRVTMTPGANGSREVKVFWTDKLDVSGDRCYSTAGTEITGVSTVGGDGCAAAGGTWRYGQPYVFHEQFSYNLAASPYQADLPARFRLGFSASTGWAVDFHQIRNLRVTSVLDLAVEKKVQSTGTGTTVDQGAWADAATVRGGENVAYRVKAWNNGISDLDPAYPATLTDGLEAVPFADAAGVTWTATASGGAQVCATWNTTTATCTGWVSSLTGTGPITASSPLRWNAAAVTADPDAAVTVVFHGALGATTAPGTYPNTAVIATSSVGGPQDDDLTNNDDTAEIAVLPGWSLAKSASPAAGSMVESGQTIVYTLDATALAAAPAGSIAGTTVKDSLAEVAGYADFDAGSVRIGGVVPAASVTVTEPTAANGHTLTIAGLDLPGGTTVPITYTVTVKTPVAPNGVFRNYVIGSLPGNPPVQCADENEVDYLVHCSTEHRTPALLQVLKAGENTAGAVVPFDGSEWAVYADDGGAPGATPVAVLAAGQRVDTGLFQTPLAPGAYWLEETKALAGFSLLPAPVAFTVAADSSVSLAAGDSAVLSACPSTAANALCDLIPAAHSAVPTIVVLDVPVLDLPDAGGSVPPWVFFLAGALVLVTTSAVAVLLIVRRRRSGEE